MIKVNGVHQDVLNLVENDDSGLDLFEERDEETIDGHSDDEYVHGLDDDGLPSISVR